MKFFSKLKQKPQENPLTYRVTGDKYWGNSLCLSKWDEDKEIQSFYGWKSERRPQVGDVFEMQMKSGRVAGFKVISVKLESDPPDMFFAEAGGVGYADEMKDYAPEYAPRSDQW